MINGIEVDITPIKEKVIDKSQNYWVTLKRGNKKIDYGYFFSQLDKPDINEVFINIGDDIRFDGTRKWRQFFKESELEFLENLSLNVLTLSIIIDEISSRKSKVNKTINVFERKNARNIEILNLLKLI